MRRLGCFIRGNSLPIRTSASTCWGWVSVEVRFPFRQGSATLATGQCIYMFLVQVVALIVWQQGVHFLLSNQNMLMGWYLRFVLVALSPDQVLILGSCNMSMQTICSRRQCLERLPLVEKLHTGFIYLCKVLNQVQLTDELFCILNLGRSEISLS